MTSPVLHFQEGYDIRWTDPLPRMAVTVSEKAAVINACMSGSAGQNIVLPAGRLMLQGEGYILSLYEFAQLQC